MTATEMRLVDVRSQVKEALERAACPLEYAVRQRWPVQRGEDVVVTYEEYSNVSTSCSVVDRIVFQVDVWAFERRSVQTAAQAVNEAMMGLGFRRVWCSEDALSGDSSGYLRKSYRFSGWVDKRSMRLVEAIK